MLWDEIARDAEHHGDWDRAISAVSAVAECYSADDWRHNAHLWHMDLLARAGRLDELAALGQDDVHARRRLKRRLSEEGHSSSPDPREQPWADVGDLATRFADKGLWTRVQPW